MKLDQTKLIELEKKLFAYQGEDRIVSSHELYDELQKTAESTYVVPTGVPSLDRILEKVEIGELVILTGPTNEGKTTLAMTLTRNMANEGVKTVWFTLEITPRQFIKKIMRGLSDIAKLPLFYIPSKNADNTLPWIEERIIEAKVKFDAKIVFIDHIHQMFSLERLRYGNVSLELGDMVAKIKDLAVRHGLIIFLVAHSKDDPQRPTAEPTKESIRDSGLISRLADTIIAVWRIPNAEDPIKALDSNTRQKIGETDTWTKVRILKNRRTGIHGTFLMNHEDHHLTEIDVKYVAKKNQDDYEKDVEDIFGV